MSPTGRDEPSGEKHRVADVVPSHESELRTGHPNSSRRKAMLESSKMLAAIASSVWACPRLSDLDRLALRRSDFTRVDAARRTEHAAR